jgi:ribosome-binding protein aMBF1 (putative translation factor)
MMTIHHKFNVLKEAYMAAQKCPVCDWEITDGGIKVTVAGKEITVCCDECAEKAMADQATA